MDLIKLLQKELEQEATTTGKMLSLVPAEKFDWQAHPKSMKLKSLATHIAELPEWIEMAVNTDGLDFENNPYVPHDVKTNDELIDFFEECQKKGREALANADVKTFSKEWVLRNGDQIYSRETKYDVIRMAYSQIIHHRAQLGVCLRLLDIPLPGSYGPSADDVTF